MTNHLFRFKRCDELLGGVINRDVCNEGSSAEESQLVYEVV